jgi:ribosomal protein S18 acetylase RimI-like enzyme
MKAKGCLPCFPLGAFSRLVLLAVFLSLPNAATAAFFLGWKSSPSQQTMPPTAAPTKTVKAFQLRVRTTQEPDLSAAASFLSTSMVTPDQAGWNSFKTTLTRLAAKTDIEALLRGRFHVIQEGKAVFIRAQTLLQEEDMLNADELGLDEDSLLLQLWWNHFRTDRHKTLLEKASKETMEENVWRDHNFALTPSDRSWLNHLQMTAVDDHTGEVVGFCEVAMLSNPLEKDGTFAPAVTNLGAAPGWRRRGIGSRLLRTAQRYARQQWGADELALYVDQANTPAINLYEKMGYIKAAACDGGDNTGDMWYMVKALSPEKSISETQTTESHDLIAIER